MEVGIVSYLPNDPKIREYRLRGVNNTIDWILNSIKGSRVVVVAQNFKKEDRISNSRVEYLIYPKGIGVAQARNVLLNRFYSSDDNFMCICDDDSTLFDYYNSTELIEIAENDPIKIKADFITIVNPKFEGFKQYNIDHREEVEHNFTFDGYGVNMQQFFMIRNLKKFYNKEIYYPEEASPAGKPVVFSEDLVFARFLLFEGLSIVRCRQWILRPGDFKKSTVVSKGDDEEVSNREHKLQKVNALKYIINYFNMNKYIPELKGVNFNAFKNNYMRRTDPLTKNSKTIISTCTKTFYKLFSRHYNRDTSYFNVPRKRKYKFTDTELNYIKRSK